MTWRDRRKLWAALACVSIVAAVVLVATLIGTEGEQEASKDRPSVIATLTEAGEGGSERPVEAGPGERVAAASGGLTPEEWFGHPDCRIVSSKGTALLMVPGATDGARYTTVDGGGVLHSGELDFWPRRMDIVKRRDGAVVTAFGGISRDEPGRPGPGARHPVRIHVDGQPLIEHEDMWRFELAEDGSSYYLVEPLAGDTSRLLIHNFDKGFEVAHDLGDLATPWPSGGMSHDIRYTRDRREVHFSPNYDGVGHHFFYPAHDAEARPVRFHVPEGVEEVGAAIRTALFVSSASGYMVFTRSGARGLELLVAKVKMEEGGSGLLPRAVWTLEMDGREVSSTFPQLSPDGRWLLFGGLNKALVDTVKGEVRFRWPANKEAQLERLRGVLGPDAGVEDVGRGNAGSRHLTGKYLYMGRSRRLENGSLETFAVDVFELEGIELDSEPIRRNLYPPRSETPPCSPEALAGRIGEHDGQLVFEYAHASL